MSARPRVVLMLKEPRPGRVKTRLARDIGRIEAAWWMRRQIARVLRRLSDPRWDLELAVAPDGALASRVFPAHLPRRPQGRGDLGARMARILADGTGPVIVVGGDIPALDRRHVAEAFRVMRAADVAIGPASDGGYWLIGRSARRGLPIGAFGKVRWSTSHALEDTLQTLEGRRVAMLETLRDVDAAADLKAPGVAAGRSG
ncbi:TIGR04282 family arsenosugar biosynthesis glycosyltransferase [Roseicyclus sp. F158]|uniref:TIGR04282 family arsenosugar biosynthesis glycosyltransferase n=1 Tax=Tropicimonas omnivorans TaxID=3075590 RepID=A0ABU3DC43_9RHOB|nr:TIGR04282 family arsenosugar biosynthesis glycosyltransferase [Roseicyclus sp. F158]MDT0681287.1 TIGR04282 family arsenosugar biosynthesis glycosyltransferase [Roseicyclus sp. F158]